MITKQQALDYHRIGRPGKVQVVPTKPVKTRLDPSMAYTPGVAAPCLEIQRHPEDAYAYTARGNPVAVKGVLFKRFAGIDVFDIELATEGPELVIQTVKLLEPTFGGINLEDIRAPECFERVLIHESTAVAKAAMDSGVARQPVDLEDYRHRLEGRLEEIAAL